VQVITDSIHTHTPLSTCMSQSRWKLSKQIVSSNSLSSCHVIKQHPGFMSKSVAVLWRLL